MKLLHYFLFFYIHAIHASEYIYPVASLCNGETILYIHQSNTTSLELFEWNTKTNRAEQILWSVFNPAGLLLLPNNSGFSFIDNGRLRIKLFQRRSPKAVDFDEPLFNINALFWIDEHTCYCSAQQNANFALFQLQDDGTMQCLIAENGKDFMYPQKIDKLLFYIERYATQDASRALHYKIMSNLHQDDNFCATAAKLILDFGDKPIIFLTMVSDKEGFVLEHAQNIDSDSSVALFTYYQIIKQDNIWHKNLLFCFEIPTNLLLTSEQRLYESLLPLLPRIVKNKVYFVDCSENNDYSLEPYFYDLSTKAKQKIILPTKKPGHYFVPMLCGEKFYCGGTVSNDQKDPFVSF